ncbi:GDSL-type esterase/lipase family protein [Actinoplanes rectilineatus]|uniref:GDSL-type esterase/lipase family protein n=1 Tax=Actinoplanes rectilineatus TaxID=113571 RepID=UPI000B0A7995|nr:GDSL-type esterase/lipase family protein [Actinoplanes rectilineatus]
MADRRTFIRAGGALAATMAVTGATPPSVARAGAGIGLPLLTWHAALADRRYAPAVIAVIGSSSSEGVGVTGYDRGYVPVLAQNLRTRFPVPGAAGGDNYTAAWGRPGRGYTWPVTGSGGTPGAKAGWGMKTLTLTAAGQTVSHRFTGTGVQVWHSAQPGGGTFAVAVDGVTVAAAVTTGAPLADRDATWSSGPLPAGAHTVTVTCLTPGVELHGFATFDGDESRGIQIYNGGHGGFTSGDFARGADAWAPRLASIRPHLVLLQLGVNDWRSGVPAATIKADLRSIIATVRENTPTDPSFVVYGSPRVAPTAKAQEYAWLNKAWREVATEDERGAVAFFDLSTRQPAPSQDNTLRFYNDDLVHMTDRGAAFTADALTAFLSPT